MVSGPGVVSGLRLPADLGSSVLGTIHKQQSFWAVPIGHPPNVSTALFTYRRPFTSADKTLMKFHCFVVVRAAGRRCTRDGERLANGVELCSQLRLAQTYG